VNTRHFFSVIFTALALFAVTPAHASLWDDLWKWIRPEVTAPEAPVAVPEVVDSQASLVAVGTFARPAIGYHAGTWTVAAEGAGMASIWVYRLQGGKWIGGEAVHGSAQTADRVYVPSVAGGLVSFRFGPKTGGTWKGPGLVMPDNRVIRTQLTTGAARLAVDGQGLILMSKDSAWGRVNADGSIGQRGRFAGLSTGEKLSFAVSTSGLWTVGMNGYSKQDASVAVGTQAGGKITAVASFRTFPEMGGDLIYCSVAFGPDGSAWWASSFGGRLRINKVANGKARWSPEAPRNMGPCVAGDRCPPRLVSLPSGVVAIYEAPGRKIMRQDLPSGKAAQIATGSQPAAAVGPDGRIVIVFVDNGLKVKTLD
jgi:hypothetical protein